ncbi:MULTISPECIES: sensor histidine kinase [unclassified Fusibacter]|uniref:sensor histidine kinase n=1 Tax=unclassified Fusibacter TaxID=2624464 RepID=UPI0013E933EF|nr:MULTISPECIES: ATP-binding protein [unclassified Fusibacter]MCK8058630.1 ATP-binding protein [Fusibacter sp. A2]NPE21705.1 hypothetical protein [Fusibacter sp. A1]
MFRDKIHSAETIILVALFTTFMGQIYIKPFASDFRLTLAVVVLNIVMLTFKDIKPMWTVNTVGVMMLLVRSTVYAFTHQVSFLEGISSYYPVLFFYFFYSVFFIAFDVRNRVKNPVTLFLSLWVCDSIPNIIELVVRQDWQSIPLESGIYTIVTIGLVRTVLSVLLVYISIYYYDMAKKRQNHQIFVDKIVLMANLKTELFFLKKSKNDIEDAMRRSYQIYQDLQEDQNKEAVLMVAKDIHEIKKDYTRVIAGLERSVSSAPRYDMYLSEVVDIVCDANKKLSDAEGKKIKFTKNVFKKLKSSEYYAIISVLNNLVVNAVEAIDESGLISLTVYQEDDLLKLKVEDSGAGISDGDLGMIYSPGFSTKYDGITGVMNSGVGLTHVIQLVETYFGGSLEVNSEVDRGTVFTVSLPLANTLEKERNGEL